MIRTPEKDAALGLSAQAVTSPAVRSGDLVEDFTLDDAEGNTRRLSELVATGPLALFFYPAAMTYGCTKESCHFRDLKGEFAALGASCVGISPDPVATLARFTAAHGLDFPLLSDADGAVARRFGVRRSFGPLRTRRTTFVIGPDLVVAAVIASELHMQRHADEALAVLRSMAT